MAFAQIQDTLLLVLGVLEVEATKDVVPELQGGIGLELPAENASKPPHQLQLWAHLVPHQMIIQFHIKSLEYVMINSPTSLVDCALLLFILVLLLECFTKCSLLLLLCLLFFLGWSLPYLICLLRVARLVAGPIPRRLLLSFTHLFEKLLP